MVSWGGWTSSDSAISLAKRSEAVQNQLKRHLLPDVVVVVRSCQICEQLRVPQPTLEFVATKANHQRPEPSNSPHLILGLNTPNFQIPKFQIPKSCKPESGFRNAP